MLRRTLANAALTAGLSIIVLPAAASAQIDFSGEWTPVRSMDNTEDPWIGDRTIITGVIEFA